MSAQVDAIYMLTADETLRVYSAAGGWEQFPDLTEGEEYSFQVELRNLEAEPNWLSLRTSDQNSLKGGLDVTTKEVVPAGDTMFVDVPSAKMPSRPNRTLFEVWTSTGRQQRLETVLPFQLVGKPPELPWKPEY